MPQVKQYEKKLKSLADWWGKVALIGKINSHSLATIILDDMQNTKEKFSDLHDKLIDNLLLEHLKKVIADNTARSQVTIDILIRNLFERTADVGFLATDEDIRQFIAQKNQGNNERLSIESRLNEYVKKYSVYNEIVILDTAGNVRANLDKTNEVHFCNDRLIEQTLNSDDDYIETFEYSDLQQNNAKSLIYSCKITENNTPGANVLGVLCLCFHFDDEMKSIFKSLDDGTENILLLMSAQGDVIASNDTNLIPLNTSFTFNPIPQLLVYKGNEFIVTSCQTDGYQGFSGLGWWAMIMTPIQSAFNQSEKQLESNDYTEQNDTLQTSRLFSNELKDIYKSSKVVNDDLSLVVLNGQVTALKQKAGEFMPVLEAIKQIGESTANIFSDSVGDLQETVISSNMNDVSAMAALAVNIMDRNLYERANDSRWWALTSSFRQILSRSNVDIEEQQKLTDTLTYINNLYTVYTNLYLFDRNGYVVAVSDTKQSNLIGKKLNNDTGVNETLKLTNSQQYIVSPFITSSLYANKQTYIYNAAITSLDEQEVIGGVGIVFDSEPEFATILTDTLPKNEHGDISSGCFAIFAERTGRVIAVTENAPFNINDTLNIDAQLLAIEQGSKISKIYVHQDSQYVLGIAASSGYREYKTTGDYENDILAFIFIPF